MSQRIVLELEMATDCIPPATTRSRWSGRRLPGSHTEARQPDPQSIDLAGDATRLERGLAAGHSIDLSAHCAPAASAHAFCAVPRLRHLEYFHDHVRVEGMLFDGTPSPQGGQLVPDPSRPGLGLELKRADAERYRVYGAG